MSMRRDLEPKFSAGETLDPGLSTIQSGSVHDEKPQETSQNAISHDRYSWQGFCDIESEAAYFSVMLREMGVTDVTVKEVYVVDPDCLRSDLPQPVYGIVMCYRYRHFDSHKQTQACPEMIWFANQLPAQNSCATLALINILMNAEDVTLDDSLAEFKKFTQDLPPLERGEALAGFSFVRNVHNSFAKKMDMQEADTSLARKAHRKKKRRRESMDTDTSDDSFEENAHHFIAVLPIRGDVWKLDGLDKNPTRIGSFDGTGESTWLRSACQEMQSLMSAAGDADYTILALCQAPTVSLRHKFSLALETIKLVEKRLDLLSEGWQSFAPNENFLTPELMQTLGVDYAASKRTFLTADTSNEIDKLNAQELLARRDTLMTEQSKLVEGILACLSAQQDEDQKAAERRWDYGPAITLWLEKLAGNGHLEENLPRFKNET
ncbi:cysteine proteinase [Aaosphaeria arxii CBS 175.79]|uniref:ubiquitinyl hydrolase 1 n=1 Tax=Aaosphaeria arxii CBS 175.79 TaxID=1450172 RepID=A0A6A5XYW9_9PLEO|nr:cysteine proteinase [Aaosphaeria arxii CBS 175.79]KAF2018515.1 cysteine proteinase [Aaosphaeria arxii CBS 175.79]